MGANNWPFDLSGVAGAKEINHGKKEPQAKGEIAAITGDVTVSFVIAGKLTSRTYGNIGSAAAILIGNSSIDELQDMESYIQVWHSDRLERMREIIDKETLRRTSVRLKGDSVSTVGITK